MSLFGKVKRIINESNHIKILLEKDSDALKQYKKGQKSFDKTFGKNIKPTVVQPSLDLYKAGGPYVPDKTTFKATGKKVPKMEPKPQFGKPKPVTKTGAPDKTLLKKAISDVKASEKRLFDKGLGKGTAGIKGAKGKPGISLARQRKYTIDKIKELSAKTTQSDARVRGSSTEGTAGASGSTKTVTPTKGVKQSEVSKKAQDFTTKVNADKKIKDAIVKKSSKSSTKSKSDVNRIAQNKIDTQKADQFKKTDAYKNVAQGKDSQGNYLTPQQRKKNFKNFRSELQKVNSKVTQGAAPDYVAKSGDYVAKSGGKSKGSKIQKYRIKKGEKFGIDPKNILTTRQKKDLLSKRTRQARTITKKMGGQGTVDLIRKVTKSGIGKKIYSKPAGKLALKSTAGIVKAASKNPYTAAAAVVGAGLLTQPNVRKGIKAALAGGGIGALTGAFAKDNRKNKPAEYGKKTYIKKGSISLSPPAPKETNYSKTMSSVKPYDFTKINKKIKADQTAKNNASYAKKNALSASEKQKQRRGIG